MQAVATNTHVIVGLGMTGLSCARYLQHKNIPFAAMDTREAPPGIDAFRSEFPQVDITLGKLDAGKLAAASALVMSPGVDLRLPEIQQALSSGVKLTGDIDLFARAVKAPIVAITGSNAKSTVTTLVGEMARSAKLRVEVAGNIGTPVLDLLQQDQAELYVLELSSFQLETTSDLGAAVATILNVSEDHLDRHASMATYCKTKHRIFQGCKQAVVNRDDICSAPDSKTEIKTFTFGIEPVQQPDSFCVLSKDGEEYLAFNTEALMPVKELKIVGQHNVANALAALALGHAFGLGWAPMLKALRAFKGLKHRCQWVGETDQVNWYNDSKGTNVGATVAAITGLGTKGKIILLAGGVGKGADFSGLAPVMARNGKQAILFGQDAEQIARALQSVVPLEHVGSLHEAVIRARQLARSGDIVLLSPACASFDMFRNYEHRGDVFMQAVRELQ